MRQLDADVTITAQRAGARQHEIAEATQSGQRVAPAACRAGQPRHLGESACDERRERVVAEAKAFDNACSDRDDVFHRAADLHANDIIAAVQAEIRRAKLGLHRLGRSGIGRSGKDSRRQLPDNLDGEAGA